MQGIEEIGAGHAARQYLVTAEELQTIVERAADLALRKLRATEGAPDRNRLLTTQEAMDMLHVKRTALWAWSKAGYLVPVKVGGKAMYKYADVEAIMQGR